MEGGRQRDNNRIGTMKMSKDLAMYLHVVILLIIFVCFIKCRHFIISCKYDVNLTWPSITQLLEKIKMSACESYFLHS
jgi:hypothetical protein